MDPHVDQSRTISIGPESTGGNAVGELKTVGSDVRLTARRMDKINGNLGQLLHEASLLDHLSGRALEPEEVLSRVQKVIGEMEPISSRSIMKLHINENVNLPCECGETMTRRVASLEKIKISGATIVVLFTLLAQTMGNGSLNAGLLD